MKHSNKISSNQEKTKIFFFEKYSFIFIILSFILLLYTLIKTAWVCDDAYITFRTIDNFVNGYGLRYNVVERVQAFTHPLWLFIVTIPYFIFRDAFYTPIIISILITLFIVIFFYKKVSISKFNSFLFILFLLASKAFIDYSTSGLENSVSHLLAIIFIFVYIKYELNNRKILILSLIFSLATLNRIDSALLYLPALLLCIINSNFKKNLILTLYGLLPFICWTIFSIIYYGYPFPNTYYAKLYTGIPLSELIPQGLSYFVDSIKFDPITLTLIFGSMVYIFYTRKKDYYIFMVGLILYLCYVIYIGGDFMSGRFFSLPFIFSLTIILTNVSLKNEKYKYGVVLALIVFMLLMPRSSVMSGENYTDVGSNFLEEHGISDERGFYYKYANLWYAIKGEKMPSHPNIKAAEDFKKWQETLYLGGATGFFSYYVGPLVYILDAYCLADPFRSKLNVAQYDIIFGEAYKKAYKKDPPKSWRVGHYLRPIPSGYTLSILEQQNLLDDTNLGKYYSVIRNLTRSDIFSIDRLANIYKMNLGFYDDSIKQYKNLPYDEGTYFNDLVRFNPMNIYYYMGRGDYYMNNKKYYEAIQDYKKYIKVERSDAVTWYRLAQCLFHERDYNNAYECLKNAKLLKAHIDPAFEEALDYVIHNHKKEEL
jgi:arabinofuranosyltransferase